MLAVQRVKQLNPSSGEEGIDLSSTVPIPRRHQRIQRLPVPDVSLITRGTQRLGDYLSVGAFVYSIDEQIPARPDGSR